MVGAPSGKDATKTRVPMRKVVVIASASGNGKTTLGRQLAERLRVPFVELDALVHGPGWVETPDEELRFSRTVAGGCGV
jgi:adenylate kinase family enzyme